MLVLEWCPSLADEGMLHAQVTLTPAVGVPLVDPRAATCISHKNLRPATCSRGDRVCTCQIAHLEVLANLGAKDSKTEV